MFVEVIDWAFQKPQNKSFGNDNERGNIASFFA